MEHVCNDSGMRHSDMFDGEDSAGDKAESQTPSSAPVISVHSVYWTPFAMNSACVCPRTAP